MAKITTLPIAALGALIAASCAEAPPRDEVAAEASAIEPAAGSEANASAEDAEYCELTSLYEAAGDCARLQRQYADLDAGRDAFSPQERMAEGQTRTVSYAITRLPKAVQGEGGELAEAAPSPPPPPPPPAPAGTPSDEISGPTDMITYANRRLDCSRESARGVEACRVTVSGPAPTAAPELPTQEEIDAAITETDAQNVSALGEDAVAVETGQIRIARFMYACLSGSPALKVSPAGCQSRDTRADPQVIWNWQVTATAPGRHQLTLRSGVEVRTRTGAPRPIGQRAVNRTITVAVTRVGSFERMMGQAERWFNSPVKAIGALTALLLAIAGLVAAVRKLRRGRGAGSGEDAG